MRVAGVDAGQKGAAALLIDGRFEHLTDLPIDDDRELDSHAFLHLLLGWEPDLVVVEDTFRPKVTVRFVGEVVAVCKVLQVERLVVPVVSWKKRVLGQNTGNKTVSVRRCRELFPEADLVRPRGKKPSDDRAEAILLAYYGSELRGGGTRK